MSNADWGKPKYSGTGTSWKNFRLKENSSSIYRLLPPMKSMAASGRWAQYYGLHWGYVGVDRVDATKTKPRAFRCIQSTDRRTKMVTQSCPECDLIDSNKEKLEQLENKLKSVATPKDQFELTVAPLRAWLKSHNCDRKWYINAMSESGEFGCLQISHRTKTTLEDKIRLASKEYGVEPLDLDQGVWFRFTRIGRGFDVPDAVEIVMEQVNENGRKLLNLKPATLTESQANQAIAVCPDLGSVLRELSFSQIDALVNCSGAPEEIDQVFGLAQPNAPETSPAPISVAPEARAQVQAPASVSAKAPAPAATKSPAESELEALQARIAELQRQVQPIIVASTPLTSATRASSDPSAMSDEDFIAQFKSQ